MSTRSGTETLAVLLVAFLHRRTWAQADLARLAGLTTKSVRARLEEIQRAGVPLSRDEDWPHVYWSVPRSWFPGGAVLAATDLATVARLVSRLPKSDERQRAISVLLNTSPSAALPPSAERDEGAAPGVLPIVEEGAATRTVVRIRYFSASRGEFSDRQISVQRIAYGDHVRALAACHRSKTLKWFRVDGMQSASLDKCAAFLETAASEIEEYLATSVQGFRSSKAVVQSRFLVRAPEARWVVRNLPEPMSVEYVGEGVRITCRSAAVEVVARFVVGLGEAARAETPELRLKVLALARGALAMSKTPAAERAPSRKQPVHRLRPLRGASSSGHGDKEL